MKRLALALAFLLVACGRSEPEWLGYAEGENALIGAPQAGWVTSVKVGRGTEVKVGDVLFTLEDTPQREARDSAQAQLAAAEQQRTQAASQMEYATKELARNQAMFARRAVSQRDVDAAQNNFNSGAAKLAEAAANSSMAKAALATAQWNLAERTVRARTMGRVEDIYFRQGEYAPASAAVIAVLPPQNVYARFFVPETELNAIKPGQDVAIECDGCPENLRAKISFIAQQAEFTPPVIYSVGNREKLVFKAEARGAGGLPLRPGLPIGVSPVEP
jgi:HlyD family secretion protein